MARPDYHDYVIKDGRFIGAFEEMYRHCDDPWHQTAEFPLANQLALWLLRQEPVTSVLDVACGLGAFTRRVRDATGAAVVGVDISPTAARQARTRCPDAGFVVMDTRAVALAPGRFDAVVVSELLWYVLPDLRRVLGDLFGLLRPGGRLIVVQQFYRPERQRYGADVMRSPEDLVRLAPFAVEHLLVLDPHMDPKCLLLARRPA